MKILSISRLYIIALIAACSAGTFHTWAQGVPTSGTNDFVEVGDAGNAPDVANAGFGEVDYDYAIGAGDVTVTDYCVFLNAVASGSDPYGVYNTQMTDMINDQNVSNAGGIVQTGSAGAYQYIVEGNISGSDPVTEVSWLDAARFANWLQNGSLSGQGEGIDTTEDGAYTLDGELTVTGSETRNADAVFALPTLDEWYKAAYYNPNLNDGGGGYTNYATQANTAPTNVVGSGTNAINYLVNGIYSATQSASYSGTTNCLTAIGSFPNSVSYYGTYDENGDVNEWTENFFGTNGYVVGGSWNQGASRVEASGEGDFYLNASDPSYEAGFRLVELTAVPEPAWGDIAYGALVIVAFCRKRRRRG
ncbi:MAG TPA: SUMF1/EgtB/PvdO family nonheme iron enzyme [Chthoniobacteraceae bacterium]|jgi:formylglycine-generating enzyme required for sulfatase activity|nr:SUMF1/EgtB/PvdO family nonheme iron enzyme [Chthoniobacteraceae bacterium]